MDDEAIDSGGGAIDPRQAIGAAIQKLMAARLARGFMPLAALFAAGALALFRGGAPWVAVGAIATGGGMLGYGLRIVQKALGRPHRPWMSLAMAASLIPPIYSLYVIGWVGFRGLARGAALLDWLAAIFGVILGVWVLRTWMQVVEVERLARFMSVNVDTEGGVV
jgi:hypothetical protein